MRVHLSGYSYPNAAKRKDAVSGGGTHPSPPLHTHPACTFAVGAPCPLCQANQTFFTAPARAVFTAGVCQRSPLNATAAWFEVAVSELDDFERVSLPCCHRYCHHRNHRPCRSRHNCRLRSHRHRYIHPQEGTLCLRLCLRSAASSLFVAQRYDPRVCPCPCLCLRLCLCPCTVACCLPRSMQLAVCLLSEMYLGNASHWYPYFKVQSGCLLLRNACVPITPNRGALEVPLLCCAVLCCAVLCCVVLCCAVLCCAVLCGATLCCAVLCCAVLCCAVLCCAALRCAALRCATLCCAVVCRAGAAPARPSPGLDPRTAGTGARPPSGERCRGPYQSH
jgi:hypothetical protein